MKVEEIKRSKVEHNRKQTAGRTKRKSVAKEGQRNRKNAKGIKDSEREKKMMKRNEVR